ncbi:MAG: hypothetical protein RQ855_01715 [Desulfurococcales archaeon]|nr:hypothetical protein [Desulfurococcales archaeon]
MGTAEHNRFFLTILFWALILEIMLIIYYIGVGELGGLIGILILVAITSIGIIAIIRNIKKSL